MIRQIPADEWAAIAAEHRQQYADARARWDALSAIYGDDWWRVHRDVSLALLRVMGAAMTAAVRCEKNAGRAAVRQLVEESGCTLDGAS